MQRFILPALCFLLVISGIGCSVANIPVGVPNCVQRKIDSIQLQPVSNPPARVEEYAYNGKAVYLISSPCCDQYNILYDAECNPICAPSGGITGKGDGRCADFAAKAVFIRTVWEDKRKQ